MTFVAPLPNRFVICVKGPDRRAFLQGLISNDVTHLESGEAIYAALLTPQGKFLHDMFVLDHEDGFLIDCERPDDLTRRLRAYKLRAKVDIENASDRFTVSASWNGRVSSELCFRDPRLIELGSRHFLAKNQKEVQAERVDFKDFDRHRLQLGVTSSSDLELEKSTLIEGNFDFLQGIDWKKGCYIGQELTARMHYRGLAKRRLFPVRIEGPAPSPGTVLENDAGEMRTHQDDYGMALLKIDAVIQETPLIHGETRLWPQIPDWLKLTPAA